MKDILIKLGLIIKIKSFEEFKFSKEESKLPFRCSSDSYEEYKKKNLKDNLITFFGLNMKIKTFAEFCDSYEDKKKNLKTNLITFDLVASPGFSSAVLESKPNVSYSEHVKKKLESSISYNEYKKTIPVYWGMPDEDLSTIMKGSTEDICEALDILSEQLKTFY